MQPRLEPLVLAVYVVLTPTYSDGVYEGLYAAAAIAEARGAQEVADECRDLADGAD